MGFLSRIFLSKRNYATAKSITEVQHRLDCLEGNHEFEFKQHSYRAGLILVLDKDINLQDANNLVLCKHCYKSWRNYKKTLDK